MPGIATVQADGGTLRLYGFGSGRLIIVAEDTDSSGAVGLHIEDLFGALRELGELDVREEVPA